MKKLQKGGFVFRALAAGLGLLAGISISQAHPYASGITNNSGTIYFILNETNSAVAVTLTNIGSGQTATLNASAGASSLPSTVGTNAGTQFFSMTQGATTYTNYSIKVTKIGNGVISQISSDANTNNMFFGPRGVAVNQNPASKNFGRIYVTQASPGAIPVMTGVPGTPRTTVGRGFYVLNADQSDVLGYGLTAQSAGITFSVATSGTTYSPFKCSVGADDNLYAEDAMTNTCQLWQVNPDLTGSAVVLDKTGLLAPAANITNFGTAQGNHGRVTSKPFVIGKLATSDMSLYTVDTDYGGFNHIQLYNIGAGPLPYAGAPSQLADIGMGGGLIQSDIAVIGSYIYVSGFRTVDNDGIPNLKIFDAAGTTLVWDSLSQSLNPGHDPFVLTEGMSVSPDGNFLATERQDNSICVVKLVNGLPDLTTLKTNVSAFVGTTGRAAGWDAADNFYIASGGVDRLRVFTMGLSSSAITSGDTTGTGGNNNGSFQFAIPQSSVSVMATTPLGSQNHNAPFPGVFTFTRAGQNLNQPLTVMFTVGGTATNGADYTFSPAVTTSITFAANQTTTNLMVNPVVDNIPRLTNTVVVTLQNTTNYSLGTPATDTVFIQNTGPQLLKANVVQSASMYKRIDRDYGSFTFQRYGDVSVAPYTVTNFALGGTAVVGVDYVPPTVTVNSGDASGTVAVFPLVATTTYVGNKTVSIGFAADATVGPGYTAATNKVNLTIIDNAYPPETLLYSSSLSDLSDAANWTIRFASTNDPLNLAPDYDVQFGFTFSTDLIGLPPNGSPTGLKVNCNNNLGASSGVNLYLNNQSFSGDFAVRFNMNLLQGIAPATSTEGALYGINHSGTATNWWGGDISAAGFHGPWSADGIWWWVDSDPGGAGAGDFLEYTGTNNVFPNTGWNRIGSVIRTSLPYAFKNVAVAPGTVPPYTTVGTTGMPANHATSDESTWSDVEMKQVRNVVTMSINKTVITTYTNTTIWTNGQIMLGYDDPFASVGFGGAAYYSNLRVVRLGPPTITAITLNGGNVSLAFNSIDGDDTAASFAIQNASVVTGPYADVAPVATITQTGQNFSAITPQSGNLQFYRVRHK